MKIDFNFSLVQMDSEGKGVGETSGEGWGLRRKRGKAGGVDEGEWRVR